MSLSSIPLGLSHYSAINEPPEAMVTLAAATGYAAIGLRLHQAFPGSPVYHLPVGSPALRSMQARMEGEGISVFDVEFVPLAPDTDPKSLLPLLETAAALGASRLSCGGDDPDHSRVRDNFAALCDLAAPFGIGVDLEGMRWRAVANFAQASAIVGAAGRPNGCVLLDSLHYLRNGGTTAGLRQVPRGKIRSVQLCDAGPKAPTTAEEAKIEARSYRLAPGAGVLPLLELVHAMPRDAGVSIEVPMDGTADAVTHAQRLMDSTRRLLALAEAAA